ncbi:M28 family peptidase [Halolamina litorea]|uniref:M28 family peptidase n=1 Tax=Halolamina litorea TaxID=1515593 RepID=A0ABD6BQ90_9EURY|nr:M28 family peptidase [Halolamina litorea]
MSEATTDRSALTEEEREIFDTIDIEEPWNLLEEFAELNRLSGTEDERRAAEYMTGRLDALGVEHQRFDPELYISQPHDATIRTINKTFEPGIVKTVGFSASTTVQAEVEYVGTASSDLVDDGVEGPREPFAELDDLEGRIALVDGGSFSIGATTVLEEKGAGGVIAIHEHRREPHDGIATPVWGGAPPYDERERIPDVPIANVTKHDGGILRDWAESEEGLELELSTELTTDWMACPIVEARIEGKADPDNDDFLLLHGHYDSWYVGITDNATGDAGMLELARVFNEHADKLKRDIRICWWPAHSTGRYAGSTWYTDEHAVEIAERCVAQVNMDSPGAKDSAEYTDMSCWTPEAHGLVTDTIDDVAGIPSAEQFPPRAGDYSFDNIGVTGFFMLGSNIPKEIRDERGYHPVGGCGGNSDAWHVSTDTLDKAGKDELLRDIRIYAVSILRVLNAELLPFDHTRYADRLIDVVEEYDEVAGDAFDFGPTIDELAELREAIESFRERAEAGDIPPSVANNAITELSRTLTRLYLVEDGQFEQDPATSRDPVPRYDPAHEFARLDGDERRFLEVQMKRAQNDTVHELRQARRRLP